MLQRLKDALSERFAVRGELGDAHTAAAAAAMLLLEVAWADHEIGKDELTRTRLALVEMFELPESVADAVLADARARHGATISMYPFTRLVNDHLDYQEKRRLLENCWRLARAEAGVDKHEEHTIRRIADLLYLSHDDFIAAKLAAASPAAPGR